MAGSSLEPSCPIKVGKKILNLFKFHALPLCNLSNILPLHLIYIITICSFMHDFINDLTPPNISELLRYSLEKTPLLYKDSQRLAISVLKTGEPNI